jgi:hypothetical protein
MHTGGTEIRLFIKRRLPTVPPVDFVNGITQKHLPDQVGDDPGLRPVVMNKKDFGKGAHGGQIQLTGGMMLSTAKQKNLKALMEICSFIGICGSQAKRKSLGMRGFSLRWRVDVWA